MPELAEVEFYRKQWNAGLKQKIVAVELNSAKRIFRGNDAKLLQATLAGATFIKSKAHGKQMLFCFSNNAWLGIHLGMTGKLRVEPASFALLKHDHLALKQGKQTLIFSDPRLFGRVLFEVSEREPDWWSTLPPEIISKDFTAQSVATFLQRHPKAPVKAVLLLQKGFPGIGNWMADEILWQAKIHPQTAAGKLNTKQKHAVWTVTRAVTSKALATIGKDFSDPPSSWLFQHRWKKKGSCPRCKKMLEHATIGGRTTCWCPHCQPPSAGPKP